MFDIKESTHIVTIIIPAFDFSMYVSGNSFISIKKYVYIKREK